MTSYAAYLRPGRPPLLVPDRFSFPAFLLGPLWLAFHAAWVPAALLLGAELGLSAVQAPWAGVVGLGLAWLVGLHAQDLRGWSLQRRLWRRHGVVVAANADTAWARALDDPTIGPAIRDAASA